MDFFEVIPQCTNSRIGKLFLFLWLFLGQIDTQLNCLNNGQCFRGLHFSFNFMDDIKPREHWSYIQSLSHDLYSAPSLIFSKKTIAKRC